eukprot:92461-Pyramimonas_sp.AAC.1
MCPQGACQGCAAGAPSDPWAGASRRRGTPSTWTTRSSWRRPVLLLWGAQRVVLELLGGRVA